MFISSYIITNKNLYIELCNNLRDGKDIDSDDTIELESYAKWHSQNRSFTDRVFLEAWNHLKKDRKKNNNSLCLSLINQICDYYLEDNTQTISVLSEKFSEWQNWLADHSAIPIIAYKTLNKRNNLSLFNEKDNLIDEIESIVNTRTIISPFHPLVEDYIMQTGLNDSHIHLNGTTSLEKIWEIALYSPDAVIQDMENEFDKSHVKKFYYLENNLGSPINYHKLLITARLLREFIESVINREKTSQEYYKELICYLKNNDDKKLNKSYQLDIGNRNCISELRFHILTIDYLKRNNNSIIDTCYLLYTIAMNCFLNVAVQSQYQKGFDQFQKIADNGIRETIEKEYYDRYCQLHGDLSQKPNIDNLEGRFSPKNSINKNEKILQQILYGFLLYKDKNKYQEKKPQNLDLNYLAEETLKYNRTTLRLIAHFIKQKRKNNEKYHFHHLRNDILNKSFILFELFEHYPSLRKIITGVDVAANEIDAPPEVFSLLYRNARRNGITHFTYHVGEDFTHLLSGIRAIYDSITFLELRNSDRIGHGTAIGITPEYWLNNTPKTTFIKRGEWLENLLFIYKMSLDSDKDNLPSHKIRNDIKKLSTDIFSENISTITLHHFFENRHLEPSIVENIIKNENDNFIGWLNDEYLETKEKDNEILTLLYKRWFDEDVFSKYEEEIEIDTDYIDAEKLLYIQQEVQRIIFEKGIVIETLPTSNVRISLYNSMEEHHIFRWLQIKERKIEGDYPMLISLGSDDPGIFATDIKNEFYHIFAVLHHKFNYSADEALNIAKKLNEISRVYTFHYNPKQL